MKNVPKKKNYFPYLSGKFSKLWSNKKSKKKVVFFLKFIMQKKKGGKLVLPPSTFQCEEGDCPQFLFPWSGISEVQNADSYGASEFMSVWSFSGVWVAQSSVFCVTVFVIFCQPLNICLFVLLYLYIYIIYC